MLETDSIDVHCLGQSIESTLNEGIDLHTTAFPLCRFASLNMFDYKHNLHAQTQTALSELETILTEVGDESTKNMPSWAERMERQKES